MDKEKEEKRMYVRYVKRIEKGVCQARDLGYWVKYTVCASPEHTRYGQVEGGNAFFDEIDGLGGGGGSEEELAPRDQHSSSFD